MSEKINLTEESNQDIVDISELINPFPGLRPFGVEESHLFFGREGQSDEALSKLADSRFVAILGASGSGKSSFMYCGLIPALHGGFISSTGSAWKVITCRPGGGPIDNLSGAILSRDTAYNKSSEEDKLIKKTIISTVLRSSSLGLVEVIKQTRANKAENVLVLVDQFEELFRFSKLEASSSEQNEASSFVNLLLEATQAPDQNIYVALTMRSDFIGECARYPDLTQMINDSHYLIPQMTRDQKRTAIEGPVAVGGGKIAPRLTQQLLNDVGDNPDQLPILQHALMRTWSNWVDTRKVGEAMDIRHYNAIGTLKEALSQHANEAYDMLNKREKEICETMFKALTERGAENTGIRRPTKLSTIAAIAGVSEDEVERVIDRFREPGRSLLMPPHGIRLESDTVIDISHEALMRIWDRLKRWLDEESKAAEMYVKLSEASSKFQEGKASLWKMPDLQLALNWRQENRPTLVWGQRYNTAYERTMVFLETSEKAHLTEQANLALLQRRKVRAMRITAIILGAAAMVSLFFVVFAQIQKGYAQENAEKAIIAQNNAELAKTEAEKNEAEAIREKLRADEAAAEALLQKNEADAQRLLAVASAEEAKRQSKLAEEQRKIAEYQKLQADTARAVAVINEGIAKEQKSLADEARVRAEQLRYQAIAQTMGIKAKEVRDVTLKGLVAKQGYDFYQEYKDENKEYQGDIYAGVYYGLQGLVGDQFFEEFGSDAKRKGDSTLNQYHGHKPIRAADQQVPVKSVSYSRDGSRMFSAGGDGKLLEWDVRTRSYTTLFSSQNVSRVVNVSPNERYLALGSDQAEIFIFDLNNQTREPIKITGHRGAIYDLIFLPDNTGFISVGADRKILFSDFKTSIEIAQTSVRIVSLALSPNGKLLAGGSTSGEVLLWDLSSDKNTESSIFRKDKHPVEALSFSSDGRYLAIGGEYRENQLGYVLIWDMIEKKQFGPTLAGFGSGVTDVEFSLDDELLAASSRDATVRFWDMKNIFDLPTVLDDHKDWVLDISFAPNGDGIMSACRDGIVRYFPVKPHEMVNQICGYLNRNMHDVEWDQFVGVDIEWQETCDGYSKPVEE